MATVHLTPAEARTQRIFQALMWALSYPGRLQALPDSGLSLFIAIGETLIDLEINYYAAHAELNAHLARLGARPRPPQEAVYQFYPALTAAHLDEVRQAPVGSYLCPDQSATLIIGAQFGAGHRLHLSGPGVPGRVEVDMRVGGLPEEFWTLRREVAHYPLGWDVFLVGQGAVLGLPRTTLVEVD